MEESIEVKEGDTKESNLYINYKNRVVLAAIIVAWALLLICFIFKLFGSKVFDIAVSNQDFINACNWLDTDGIWMRYIMQIVLYLVSTTFLILASALRPSFKTKWLFIIIPILCAVWVVKFFHAIAGLVVEAVAIIVIPSVMSRKWWYGFVGYALDLLFQVLSMFIRGQDMAIFGENTILSLIMLIDYYIMIALFYLFAIVIHNRIQKKEE